jgi:hypothetical protein
MKDQASKQVHSTWYYDGRRYEIISYPEDSDNEMLSVYEYLGNRTPTVGTGLRIYEYAKAHGYPMKEVLISTTKYSGPIKLYERSFLDFWFEKEESESQPHHQYPNLDDDELPF